jgi:single-strand DNA-binding protein
MANFNYNEVKLGGRLTADPEFQTTASGVAKASFSVAVSKQARKDEERKTDFFDVIAWRQTAEFISRYFKKGSSIFLTGSIQFRFYEGKDGKMNKVTEIVAEKAYFVDGKNDRPQFVDVTNAPSFDAVEESEALPF